MDEYIKRSDVIDLIENAIRKSKTVHGVLVCANLRTAVMGLRNADVAPRAEVAMEIFTEIERLMLDGEIGCKYPAKVINPDKYAEIKEKYTKPGPQKGDHHE